MRFRFIHAADIHLGYEQYNLTARANDFAKAYLAMVEYARSQGVDFVLLAGDLFHRSSADAWMMKQASHGLRMLRDVGIPVVAVEGNHDAQHARKSLSWMEFLADEHLLSLLNVEQNPNGHRSLVPFHPEDRRGSWTEVAGARIYGMKYYGAATARYLEEVQDQVEMGPHGYTVMMLHAGMQGQVPHLHGGLTPAQLMPLRERGVDYLALGHVHKRLQNGWIFNPGSLEINSLEEIDWPHGFFDVRVDTESAAKHTVKAVDTPTLRPFRRITVHTEGSETLQVFSSAVEDRISAERDVPTGAVIEIDLGGVAGFRRQDLPVEKLKAIAEVRFSPLVVRVRNNLVPPGIVEVRQGERMKRAELERTVVEHMVYQDPEYRDRASAWTSLILDVKNMAANRDTAPATIADHVQNTLAQLRVWEESEQEKSELSTSHDRLGGEPPCMAQLFEEY